MRLNPEDLIHAYNENRLAIASIDLEYMFEHLGEENVPHEARFDEFNKDCDAAHDFFRWAGIPIVYVGFNIKKRQTVFHLTTAELQELERNIQLYPYNKKTGCVDKKSRGYIKTDLIPTAHHGDMIFLRQRESILTKKDPRMHDRLRSKGIDTLLFDGLFKKDCVTTNMNGARRLGYKAAAIVDLIEDQVPEQNTHARIEKNERYFEYNKNKFDYLNFKEMLDILMPHIITKKERELVL